MRSPSSDLVVRALRDPERLAGLSPASWDLLIRQARSADLLARIGCLLEDRGLLASVPPGPGAHLAAARTLAAAQQDEVRREVAHIGAALRLLAVPVVLLKGAAYVLAELPPALGRMFADVDVLVPRDRLADVEAALMLAGWATTNPSEYDQQYYRRWMHELPPLQHIRRQTVLDVHHAILPDTARLRPPSAQALRRRPRPSRQRADLRPRPGRSGAAQHGASVPQRGMEPRASRPVRPGPVAASLRRDTGLLAATRRARGRARPRAAALLRTRSDARNSRHAGADFGPRGHAPFRTAVAAADAHETTVVACASIAACVGSGPTDGSRAFRSLCSRPLATDASGPSGTASRHQGGDAPPRRAVDAVLWAPAACLVALQGRAHGNRRGGVAYLRWARAYFAGEISLVAAAYNAGERSVERYRGVPPYEDRELSATHRCQRRPGRPTATTPASQTRPWLRQLRKRPPAR